MEGAGGPPGGASLPQPQPDPGPVPILWMVLGGGSCDQHTSQPQGQSAQNSVITCSLCRVCIRPRVSQEPPREAPSQVSSGATTAKAQRHTTSTLAWDKAHRPPPGQGSWGSWESLPLQTASTGFPEALRPCVDCRQPLPIRGVGTDKLLHARPEVQSECRQGQDRQSRAPPPGCSRTTLQEAGVEGVRRGGGCEGAWRMSVLPSTL